MNPVTRGYPSGNLRVSDAERDQAITELSEHFQAGRLTADEFDERSGQALQARTRADLASLLSDLPGPDVSPAVPGPNLLLRRVAARTSIVAIGVAVASVAIIAAALNAGPRHHGILGLLPLFAVLLILRVIRLTRPGRRG